MAFASVGLQLVFGKQRSPIWSFIFGGIRTILAGTRKRIFNFSDPFLGWPLNVAKSMDCDLFRCRRPPPRRMRADHARRSIAPQYPSSLSLLSLPVSSPGQLFTNSARFHRTA